MFENVGGKIKMLATIAFFAGLIASVIGGIAVGSMNEDMVFMAFCVIIGGVLVSWIGSVMVYGFGELIATEQELLQIKKDQLAKNAIFGSNTMTEKKEESAVSTKPVEEAKAEEVITIPVTEEEKSMLEKFVGKKRSLLSYGRGNCEICGTFVTTLRDMIFIGENSTEEHKFCKECSDKLNQLEK